MTDHTATGFRNVTILWGIFWGAVCVATSMFITRGSWLPVALLLSGLIVCVIGMYSFRNLVMFWIVGIPTAFVFVNNFIKKIPIVTAGRALFAFIAIIMMFRHFMRRDNRPGDVKNIEKYMVLFLVAIFVSLLPNVPEISSPELYKTMALLVDGFVIPFFSFTISRLQGWNDRDRRVIFAALLMVGVYLVVIGTLQFFFRIDYFLPTYIELNNEKSRATGSFTNPVEYGGVLSVLLILTLLQYSLTKRRGYRIVLALAGMSMLFGIVLCKTRAVWLSLAVALVIVYRKDNQIRRTLKITAGICFVALVIALPFLLDSRLYQRRMTELSSAYNRVALYATSANMIVHNPIIGIGFGLNSFKYAKGDYAASVGPVGSWYATPGVPHNEFLHIFVLTGLAGIIPYLLIYHSGFRIIGEAEHGCDGCRDVIPVPALAKYMTAIFWIVVVNGLFVDMVFFSYMMTLYYFLLGMLVKGGQISSCRKRVSPYASGFVNP